MSALTIGQTREGDGRTLRLAMVGQVDEDADYSTVKTDGVDRLIFDFEGVKLINSTGLQAWIRFLEGIDKRVEISFARCSIRVVTQINMFPGFTAGRKPKIESFFAPYFCSKCDMSCDILVTAADHPAELAAGKAPKKNCPKCGAEAEFDGIEKKYFLFLKA